MKQKILELYQRFGKSIRYIFFSCITALIELTAGLIFINLFSLSDVVSNTIGVTIGSVIHYYLVTRKVFAKSVDIRTVLIYAGTFLMGLGLQDLVVYSADKLLWEPLGSNISYVISKCLSLVVSFVIMYQIRKLLYTKLGRDLDE